MCKVTELKYFGRTLLIVEYINAGVDGGHGVWGAAGGGVSGAMREEDTTTC